MLRVQGRVRSCRTNDRRRQVTGAAMIDSSAVRIESGRSGITGSGAGRNLLDTVHFYDTYRCGRCVDRSKAIEAQFYAELLGASAWRMRSFRRWTRHRGRAEGSVPR
jgi:hypothetical protein